MAGINTNFDDGGGVDPDSGMQYTAQPSQQAPPQSGAIDTGDNSGALPVAQAAPAPQAPPDNSGAAPVAPPDQQVGAGATKRFGPLGKIVSYLMGEGAEHPQVLDQAAAGVDPSGTMSRGDRNVLAIQKARDEQGPDAAWKLVQANRVAYNAKQAFAFAALNGSQQKPADLNAAIQAANQAGEHVLDGTTVQFAPGQNGVTATVTGIGETQPQTYNLTPEQFRQYLNVGGAGQWDRMMQNGVPGTIAKLAQTNTGVKTLGQAPPMQRPQAPAAAPPANNSESAGYTPQAPQTNFGKTPSTVNLSGNDEVQPPAQDKTNYGEELEARAMRMFPSVSQQAQRDQWMAGQEEKSDVLQNKVDVAKETGENRVKVARETGNARVASATVGAEAKTKGWQYASDAKLKIAQTQLASKIQQQESTNANASQTRALKAIQTKIMGAQALTPQEQSYMDSLPGAGTAGAQVTKPGQQQPPAQQQAPQQAPQRAANPQQPPVQGAKLYKGQWYTRGANGESVPVQ